MRIGVIAAMLVAVIAAFFIFIFIPSVKTMSDNVVAQNGANNVVQGQTYTMQSSAGVTNYQMQSNPAPIVGQPILPIIGLITLAVVIVIAPAILFIILVSGAA